MVLQKAAAALARRRRGEPYSGADGDDAKHEWKADRLAHQYRSEERSGDRVDRHGVGDPRWRGALQGVDPKVEGRRAAEDAQAGDRDPLLRVEFVDQQIAAADKRKGD